MPELPEVQTVVTDLSKKITGKTIRSAEVLWPRTISKPAISDFVADLEGSTIRRVSRRGKFIVIRLDRGKTTSYWLTHLRMTGQFHYIVIPTKTGIQKHKTDKKNPLDTSISGSRIRPTLDSDRGSEMTSIDTSHLRISLIFTDGSHLLFTDPRKFARMYLVSDPAHVTGKLGPEPLEIGVTEFIAGLQRSRKRIKSLLLDQTFLSGIGNIYADESLHSALLHPLTPAHKVTKRKAAKLHAGIQEVLKKGISLNGASIDRFYKRINGQSGGFQDEFTVYARTGLPCLRCGTLIRKTTVAQRGTHYCPSCQKPVW